MPRPPADTRVLIPASVVLQRLHDEVPTDHFTLGWLMDGLHRRPSGSSRSCSLWSRSHQGPQSQLACYS
jgi:hypothetical protein